MARRIIQISSSAGTQHGPGATEALCDDGTVWAFEHGTKTWWQLPSLPDGDSLGERVAALRAALTEIADTPLSANQLRDVALCAVRRDDEVSNGT